MSAQRSLKPRSNYSGCNTILMSKVCYEFGGAIIVKHKIKVTVTTGKPIGCNLFSTKKLIYLLFRLLTTEEFRRRIKERMLQQRRMDVSPQMMMLIPPQETKVWGEKRIGNKIDMIAEMIGYKPRINSGRDDPCMSLYLSRVSRSGLDQPSMLTREQFLPVDAPLLDFLVEDVKNPDGWKYPRLEDLEQYQVHRGLSLDMLQRIEVRELVCGVSSDEEVKEVRSWIQRMQELDQKKFRTQVVSLDVEDVKTTYYDTLRMAGKLSIDPSNAILKHKCDPQVIHGFSKDVWKQVPGKIMFGNGVTWTCLISLDLEFDERKDYILKEMTVQAGIIELLRELPVSAGLAIRRDIRGVEEFYSLISGKEITLERGFIDLTTLAILAGYKFQSKNMTAMSVQVHGTLLNKNVSTGDDCWGIRWEMIPKSLQCYALGDIRFGFITYNVLAGLLLRDVFPDPDILCRFLKGDQETAVTWFLEFLVMSLEGTEYHQIAEDQAQTREEMVRSLRFRDAREKLCEYSPPLIKVWAGILGNWPSPTSGGCRFLLQCRDWFLVQMGIIARARILWSGERVIRVPTEAEVIYSRFGLSVEDIGDQSWIEPVPGVRGLMRPGGVKFPILDLKIESAKSKEIGRVCSEMGRSQRWSLLEWGRMNPRGLKTFFVRMTRDVGFQRFYANLYDGMRLIHLRIFNEKITVVETIEKTLTQAVVHSLSEEKTGLEKAESEVEIRRKRVEWLTGLSSNWEFEERTKWREDAPELPGWKKRGGVKRSGSVSRSKPNRAKRLKMRALRAAEEASGRTPSQPSPGKTGVRNELGDLVNGPQQEEELEDVVILEEDDEVLNEVPSLESRGSVLGSAGSSSLPLESSMKRMSAASRRPSVPEKRMLSYDELIEGAPRMAFPDELDFEFEIPSEDMDL